MKQLTRGLLGVFAIAVLASNATAASPSPISSEAPADHDKVEMFDAIEKGDIEVTFIPKDATGATVLLKNKTDKPLAVKLPEAFAGVPVLAQFGGGGFGGGGLGGGGLGGGGLGGGSQGLGGGFGGGGIGGGGFGGGGLGGGGFGGGGFMAVGPESTRKVAVTTVCLEHGKPDPRPKMKYKIVPIETFTDNPEVIEVCKMVGRGEVPQNAAQAVVWHLMDGLSWDELANKDRVRTSRGYVEKWFAPREMAWASKILVEAKSRAKNAPSTDTNEESLSELRNQQNVQFKQ
ncbi:MAG: hypothetical protein NXI22_05540 [bacterium]|nr:hypothetical protein [bacterium]